LSTQTSSFIALQLSRRNSYDYGAARNVTNHDRTSADDRPLAYRKIFANNRASSDVRPASYLHTTGKPRTSGDVGMIFQHAVVLHNGACIYNHVCSHFCIGVDYGSGHYRHTGRDYGRYGDE
jgi:hypothetical protein